MLVMWYVYSKQKLQISFFDFIKVIEIIDNVHKNGNETSLMESLCSPSYSDYFVAYLR